MENQDFCHVYGAADVCIVRYYEFRTGPFCHIYLWRGWETQIISSVVIGGTSMLGGIGTIWGTLIGVLFTGVITNAMTLLNVNEFMQYVINGALMFFRSYV